MLGSIARLAGMWLLLVALGCNGGGSKPANQPGSAEFKLGLSESRLQRLAPVAAADSVVVSGMLELNGMTVLDAGGAALPGPSPFAGLLVRLVDPDEDIFVETIPDAGGNYELQLALPPRRAVLEVVFRVQADLNGDGSGGDTVRQRLALALAAGRRITADFVLTQQLGLQPGAPASGPVPTVVTAQVSALDLDGEHSLARASLYQSGELVADVDGDGKFDALRDLVLADSNADSLPDASAALYHDSSEYDSVYGVLSSLDEFRRRAEVLVRAGDSGYIVEVSIEPQAAIELYLPDAPGGASFARLNPGQFMVGRRVYFDGFFTDGAVRRKLTAFGMTVLQP